LQGLVRKLGQLRRERLLEDAELSLLQGRLDSVAQLLDALTEREVVVRSPLEEQEFSPSQTLQALLKDMKQRYQDAGFTFEWHMGQLPETLRGDVRRLAQLFERLCEDACQCETTAHHRMQVELLNSACGTSTSASARAPAKVAAMTGLPAGQSAPNHCCLRLEMHSHPGLDVERRSPSCVVMARRLIDELGGSYRQVRQGDEESLEIVLPLTWPDSPIETRILVVDDGPVNAMLARTVLGRQGLTVETASNGEEALVARGKHFYSLVFMDIFMPGMDGVTTTQRWREQESLVLSDRRSVIIALTANASEKDREHFFAAGLDDYLGKPYRPQALIDKVRLWLPDVILTPPTAEDGSQAAGESDK
jgi:CheY-like chemotaxis protein